MGGGTPPPPQPGEAPIERSVDISLVGASNNDDHVVAASDSRAILQPHATNVLLESSQSASTLPLEALHKSSKHHARTKGDTTLPIMTKDELARKFASLGKGLKGLGPRQVSANLDWNVEVGRLFGRDEEQNQLVNLYNTCKENHHVQRAGERHFLTTGIPCDVVVIQGATGVGKTAMALSLQQNLQETNSSNFIFIQTKFEQFSSPDPAAPFLAACTDFCVELLKQSKKNHRDALFLNRYAQAIVTALDGELGSLTNFVPELQTILDTSNNVSEQQQQQQQQQQRGTKAVAEQREKSKGANKRLKYVLRLFFRAIGSASDNPIVFFMDDLHWAREGSLDILEYLLSDKCSQGIFFIATCLDDFCKISCEAPLSSMGMLTDPNRDVLQELLAPLVQEGSVNLHPINLTPLGQEAVQSMLFTMLDKRQSGNLSELIYSATKGNPLLIKASLRSIKEKDALRFNERRKEWTCDQTLVPNLFSQFETVHDVFAQRLLELPSDVQETLKVAAFLASHVIDEYLLQKIVKQKPNCISDHLALATKKGLLVRRKVDGELAIAFVHDAVQRAAYTTLVPPASRAETHLRIGHDLWNSVEGHEELDVFVIAYQSILGSACLKRADDRASVARLCLQAGEKAAQSSSFQTALVFLMHGVELVSSNPRYWRDHYELCLRLHNIAAEICYCNAEFDRLADLFEAVLSNGRRLEDTMQIRGTQIYALGSRNQMVEAIEFGLNTVRELGIHIPSKPSLARTFLAMGETRRLLRSYSDQAILRLPVLEDSRIEHVMILLNHLCLYCFFANPLIAMNVAPQMVNLTLKHGLCSVSAVALSFFSMFVCGGCIGSVDEGHRIGKLALKVHGLFESDVFLSRVSAAYFGVVAPWREPLQSVCLSLKRAHHVGLATGDVEFAMLNAIIYCYCSLEVRPIHSLNAELIEIDAQMEYFGQETLRMLLKPLWQMTRNLMGLSVGDPTVMDGDVMDIEQMTGLLNETPTLMLWVRCNRMILAYLFGRYDVAEQNSKHVKVLNKSSLHSGQDAVIALFYKCMTILAKARRKPWQWRGYVWKARRYIKRIRKWACECPSNFSAKQCLLEAELAAAVGNQSKAIIRYRSAILLARDANFLPQEALANERLGKYYLDLGNKDAAIPFLQAACEVYGTWGAVAKVRHLKAEFQSQFIELL